MDMQVYDMQHNCQAVQWICPVLTLEHYTFFCAMIFLCQGFAVLCLCGIIALQYNDFVILWFYSTALHYSMCNAMCKQYNFCTILLLCSTDYIQLNFRAGQFTSSRTSVLLVNLMPTRLGHGMIELNRIIFVHNADFAVQWLCGTIALWYSNFVVQYLCSLWHCSTAADLNCKTANVCALHPINTHLIPVASAKSSIKYLAQKYYSSASELQILRTLARMCAYTVRGDLCGRLNSSVTWGCSLVSFLSDHLLYRS